MIKIVRDYTVVVRKYIVVSSKFTDFPASACPLAGQIATNSYLIARVIHYFLDKWSYKYYGSIAVSLYKKNKEGTYDAIIR